ncbi:hypothetical protein V6N11_019534 [Hibiscus sabdariffa]|uniref:Uncharacterized protein n=2 Tax=Hibiscus sabdariffa TaxID=183260 RepID=A0ABR1ZW91_9ROSI
MSPTFPLLVQQDHGCPHDVHPPSCVAQQQSAHGISVEQVPTGSNSGNVCINSGGAHHVSFNDVSHQVPIKEEALTSARSVSEPVLAEHASSSTAAPVSPCGVDVSTEVVAHVDEVQPHLSDSGLSTANQHQMVTLSSSVGH